MTPDTPPQAFVIRPLTPRLWAVGAWFIMAGLAALIVTVIRVTATEETFSFKWWVWVPSLVVALVGAVRSFLRMALIINDDQLVIRNAVRTWRVKWDEIAEIGLKYVGLATQVSTRIPPLLQGRTPPALGVRLVSGRYVPAAQASAYLRPETADDLLSNIEGHAKRHAIPVTLVASDLISSW